MSAAGRAQHGHVVRFGAAAGEYQFARIAVEERRYLPPRPLQTLLGDLPEMMDTGRVAVCLVETRQHGLQHFRRHRGCRVVIEVEMLHLLLF
jgi:hypothetical protein